MMFSAKLFAVISAALAVAAAQGTVNYCDSTGCHDLPIDPNACTPLPNDVNKQINSFNVKQGFSACTVYTDPNCVNNPQPLPLTNFNPAPLGASNLYIKCAP